LAEEWLNRSSIQAPEAATPSKTEQYPDACKLVAEYRGVSVEQFFKREPERYQQYRRLVLEE